jgi:hypothetical protein
MRLTCLALAFALAAAGNVLSQTESRSRPTWQDAMAKGLVPYHQLTVDDFPINNKAHPENSFYIQTAADPQYHFIIKPYNGSYFAYIDEWVIFSGLNKNETSRKSRFKTMKAALPYAQAILDISEIHLRQLAALKVGELPQTRGNTSEEAQAQLLVKIKEFLAAKSKDSEAEVEAFMKATGRGTNEKKVLALAAEIKKRLEATPNTTVPFTETSTPGSSPPVAPVAIPNASPAASATPNPSPSS